MQIITLKHSLSAAPTADDFISLDAPLPDCPEDGIVVKVSHLSLDPYIGTRLRGNHMGEAAPIPQKEPIPAAIVGEVVESRTESFQTGDYIHSMDGGWQTHCALSSPQARRIDVDGISPSAYLGILGMPGLTAWAGVTQLAKVTEGDVFLVNAAAGPVGGTAGQIAKLRGAKTVIGIAGGVQKCALVTETYGFDTCLDYKSDGWQDALKTAAPDGISAHFENVSTDMLLLALQHMQLYGRAVLCGLAAHYHAGGPPASIALGPIIGKRAQLHGLVVYDFYDRWDAFRTELVPHVRAGQVTIREDKAHELEAAPALMEKLVNGQNVGKCVVELTV